MSVRSFHVPATPFTSAWPPSLPSVPTSRATRVTSEAKERSWSTIVLMVFFSSRISPFTSTVIFFERSPLATAVVTAAMLRTWPVRLPAIGVHGVGQILPRAGDALAPPPGRRACLRCPPRAPRASLRRRRSRAGPPSCSRSWPCAGTRPRSGRPSISSAMVCDRSPLATAPITRAVSLVGWTRSPIRLFTHSSEASHDPRASGREARWGSLPSLPTTRATRSSSRAIRSFSSTTSLKTSAIFRSSPEPSSDSRTEKSPRRKLVESGEKGAAVELARPVPVPVLLPAGFTGSSGRELSQRLLPDAAAVLAAGRTTVASRSHRLTLPPLGQSFHQALSIRRSDCKNRTSRSVRSLRNANCMRRKAGGPYEEFANRRETESSFRIDDFGRSGPKSAGRRPRESRRPDDRPGARPHRVRGSLVRRCFRGRRQALRGSVEGDDGRIRTGTVSC